MEFAYSSSSSSSSSFLKSEPHFIYDVFIKFWGEDIGKKFVSHLHSVLLQAQVKTLINEETLQEGMKFAEHMRAIAGSKIVMMVFTKTDTKSTRRCILEVEKILECHQTFGQIVLSVFYEIDPLDVRFEKDGLGKALGEAALKSPSGKQLEYWWCRQPAGIFGWDVRDFRHDAELVKVIVSHVQTLLGYADMSIPRFPLGLESQVEKVIGCIENHSTDVCMIGIWGMGGSGKTTLAKAIYNRIYRPFIGKSFIENIRDVWNAVNKRHVELQEHLLYDVLKSKFEVESYLMGRTVIKNEFSRRKLLIVLDDVNEFCQLENLCGNRKWFGQGTVIIITTRDVRVLNRLQVSYVYKMDYMNKDDSLELFSCHAFGEAKPRKELDELARNTVAYCGGLPLALEVLGSFLCDKKTEEWENVLSKLKVIPFDQVQRKLKKSLDGLSYDEKNVFLDVCCFFVGKERGYVTEILNGWRKHADIRITVLIELDLIKVGRNNKLEMHPLLQHMGREIIRQRCPQEPWKRSRLWFQDDVKVVLKNNTGTEATEGLSLKLYSTGRDYFKTLAFKKLKRLRLLQLDHVQLIGDYGYLSKQLRWICWQGFPSKYIPNNFCMKNVIAMELKHSNLQLFWKQPQELQVLERLKFLNLSHSKYLIETPDFSTLPSLERLILKDCPSLCKVHPSIGDLCNLLLLNLKNCTNLRSLPREIYKSKSLRTLILSGCFKIDILEEDIGQMKSLITLITENTAVRQDKCSVQLETEKALENNNWPDLASLRKGLATI